LVGFGSSGEDGRMALSGLTIRPLADGRLRCRSKLFETLFAAGQYFMRIDLVALCDAAVEVNGRLHILGSIDYFWAATLPYFHAKCALVARLRWDGHERTRKHKGRVYIIDADGLSVGEEFVCKFIAPTVTQDDVPAVRNVILDLQSLRFHNYGPYAVRIEVDGEELASLPFSVVPPTGLQHQRAA
jgi:hypothetical protein